jgi:hypothetical protein
MSYAPSIQPYLLSKWVKAKRPVGPTMLVDSDVLFSRIDRLPIPGAREILGSDVGGYINADYLDGTDPRLLDHLAGIAGIDPDYVRQSPVAIGAQYLLPDLLDGQFWQRVEAMSNAMYSFMKGYQCAIHEVQKWTASMWAMLYAFYRLEIEEGYTVNTHENLRFVWGSDKLAKWDGSDILHMAGITADMKTRGCFHKGDYTAAAPFGHCLEWVADDNCSRIYADAIVEFSKATGLTTQCNHRPAGTFCNGNISSMTVDNQQYLESMHPSLIQQYAPLFYKGDHHAKHNAD